MYPETLGPNCERPLHSAELALRHLRCCSLLVRKTSTQKSHTHVCWPSQHIQG